MTANAPQAIVIVGASLAGAKAAETLRADGFTGRITLIGDEPDRPYERPPLSKGLLLGTAERDSVFVHPESWYAENDVDLRLRTRATAVHAAGREVLLDDGERLRYDALLLATGSEPRRLDVPGADLAGVHYLRRLADSDALKAGLARAERVAVIGGGWIGLEVAAAARTVGRQVTVLEVGSLPLVRVLGPEVAQVFADLHRDHGVDLRCEVRVERLLGESGAVRGVGLGSGEVVDADLVVVGVGIAPQTALAQGAGLDVENGIRVDAHLRTSDPDIYAAGDVANAYHPVLERHIRVEHWANALRQGPVAARSMLGQDVTYARLPYFYTDQYDLGMEYTGHAEPGAYDRVVVRGDAATREFIAFWLAGGRVLAGMSVNIWDVTSDIARLVRSGRPVDVDRLADPDVPIPDV